MAVLLDTHCHLDRYQRPPDVWRAAHAAGIVTIAVTELPSSYRLMQAKLGRRPGLRLALGWHPLAIARNRHRERRLFDELLPSAAYVGEVGLDGSRGSAQPRGLQLENFEWLLGRPGLRSKVLTVHSRGAEADTIAALVDVNAHAIMHWYTGPMRLVDLALDAGLYFSFNPAMLRSRSGQRLMARVPKERVLTETDGPYVKVARRTVVPSDVRSVVSALAASWRMSVPDARDQVYTNMELMYRGAAATAEALNEPPAAQPLPSNPLAMRRGPNAPAHAGCDGPRR